MLPASYHQFALPIKSTMLASACKRLTRPSEQALLQQSDLLALSLAWGNHGYAASLQYLLHTCRCVQRTDGPIVECGSGVTSLAMATLTRQRNIEYVVLEHDRQWYNYMGNVLDTLGFDNVQLQYSPLKEYPDGFHWYSDLSSLPSGIELVVCDGPPGGTQGGRYGMLPLLDGHLNDGCVVLLDDTHRKRERFTLAAWKNIRDFKTHQNGTLTSFTELVLGESKVA